MIGICDVEIQAANPSMPLFPMRAFEGSPSSIRVRNVPKKIGKWNIKKVYFSIAYPDSTTHNVECKLVGGVYVGTVSGCNTVGNVKNGYSIFADGEDENGNDVTNYCLGKGDVQILDARGITEPLQNVQFMQILSAQPTTPNDGDMWQINGIWYIQQDGQAWAIGDESGAIGELTERVDELEEGKQDKLSDAQISAIDSVVDERATTIRFNDDTSATFNWSGEINHQTMVDDGLYDEQGRRWAKPITSIELGKGVTSIANTTFRSCTSLSNLFIPDSVTSIGQGAFSSAIFTSVTIPNSVTSIGINAFQSCSNLTSIVFEGKTIGFVGVMANYPWGLNASNIKTWNAASQEDLSAYALSADVQNVLGDIETILNAL